MALGMCYASALVCAFFTARIRDGELIQESASNEGLMNVEKNKVAKV